MASRSGAGSTLGQAFRDDPAGDKAQPEAQETIQQEALATIHRRILLLKIQPKQARLTQPAREEPRPGRAARIVLAVVRQVAFLTERAEIGMLVMGGVLIEVSAGQNDDAVLVGQQTPLPVNGPAILTPPLRAHEADVMRELRPIGWIAMFDF